MSLRKQCRRRSVVADINVVPYIDVMLVLLVIFMITTPLLTQGVKIHLPHAHAKPVTRKHHKPIIVTVDQQGHYYLNLAKRPHHALDPQRLATRLSAQMAFDHQQHLQRPILVKGDKNASYGQVMQAMVLMQKAGVQHIGLVTKPGKHQQTA